MDIKQVGSQPSAKGPADWLSGTVGKLVVWESLVERYPHSRVRFEAHVRIGNQLIGKVRALASYVGFAPRNNGFGKLQWFSKGVGVVTPKSFSVLGSTGCTDHFDCTLIAGFGLTVRLYLSPSSDQF